MPTTSLTKTQFEQELTELTRLKEHVAAVLRPAVEAYLAFAKKYRELHDRVERKRRHELRSRLGVDDYQHQRLMAIAEASKTLLGFKRALPPAMESLYEVARIARRDDGVKKLRAAIDAERLTPTAGIREIREIRTGAKRKKSHRVTAARGIGLMVSECDETCLANLLGTLLEADANARIQSDSQSLVDATKRAVADRYEQQATGSGGTIPRVPDVRWNVQAAYEQLEKGTKPSGTKADDVVKNDKHPYHSETIPNPALAAKLKAHAEEQRWLVPEMGLPYEHYAPEVKRRQDRISKR
jgi:hypothetical protein